MGDRSPGPDGRRRIVPDSSRRDKRLGPLTSPAPRAIGVGPPTGNPWTKQTLREMLAQVKHGGLTRRRFVQALAAVGLGGPVAGHLLGAAGVATAQPREAEFTPTRRGGGGTLRILMWDAPTLLHPHFGRGLRDFTVQRIFYEPLAAPAADGTFVPVLAEELPNAQGGHAGQGRPVGDVAAQAQRALARRHPVHRRRRDLQLGVRDRSLHRRGHPRGLRGHHADRADRLPHREARLQEAPALLGLRVHGRRAAPASPLRAGQGRRRPRGHRHAPRGGHRALPARRVAAGRLHPRGDQQDLPRAEPAVLRPARDQVRRRRGGGGPRGAADRRVRLRLLRAGGGGGPAADRAGRQGPRPHHPEQRGELHPVQPDGSVARGGRRALEPQGPAPAAERAAGAHRAEPAGGPRGHPGAPGRAHRPDHRQLPELARALPLAEHHLGVQRREGQRPPGPGGLRARRRRGARQGRPAAALTLPGRRQRDGAEGPDGDQAGGRARGRRDGDQGDPGLGVLRRRRQQRRHQRPLPRGSADLHRVHRPRSRSSSWPSSSPGRCPPRRTAGRGGTSRGGGTRTTTACGARPRWRWTRSSGPPSSSR